MSDYIRKNRVPLPPPDAKVTTTACDYCVVACGYKVYTWPVGKDGGPQAAENAFNVDFPTSTLGWWISPNQHNIVSVDGQPHNALVLPDNDATVVNIKGNHSIRGGTNALKAYNPETPTRDRLLYPQIRVNGQLERVSWDTALDVMAAVSKHVLAKYGEMAWAMKTYSYEFFENTYAITKLAWGSINTAAFAQHDKPGMSSDTGGMDDAGIITFNASYKDYAAADVLFISGTDPFETKTVVFTSWMLGKKLIMVVPRRTAGVAYAEQNGGLHLPVIPGTDTILHLAINRIILENGWEDKEFIDRWIANSWEVDAGFGRGPRNTPWQWRTTWGQFQSNYNDYKEWLLKYEPAELEKAAATTGVPAEKIRQAAEMLTGGGGPRPKASFNFEKGNYWSHNYLNTASLAALGLLCGSGNRPGRVISRLGGHQRGWMAGASYPMDKTPEKLPGRRRNQLDLDRWVMDGNVRFAWVIGNTWSGGQGASQFLAGALRAFTRENPNQVTSTDKDEIIATLLARVDSGGMVIVDSDIYPVEPINTELADIVLPAAQWGEHDVTRCNGERRLRLYSKFYDAPGEAQPDWWAIAQFAKKMGYAGYDWKDGNDVFEEAARFSRGSVLDYYPLVWLAKRDGKRAHELLREYGTEGIQTPIRYEGGQLVGTERLHDPELKIGPPEGPTVHPKWLFEFDSHSGKALLLKTPWEVVSDYQTRITPDPAKGEFWLTTGRVNEKWQSGADDARKPVIHARWPENYIEIHPDDAAKYEIESGDYVRLFSDDILVQTGGWIRVKSYRFADLDKAGYIQRASGEIQAVAIVTDNIRPGVIFSYFLFPNNPANALVHAVPDPISNAPRYKLGKTQIERLGESPYKSAFDQMTFKPRTVTPKASG